MYLFMVIVLVARPPDCSARSGMTELQAERAAESLGVPRVEARSKRLRYLMC